LGLFNIFSQFLFQKIGLFTVYKGAIRIRNMRKKICPLIVLSVLMLISCNPESGKDLEQPVTSDDTPIPAPILDLQKFEVGEKAVVESVEPVFLESFPLQVHVQISGDLPDGCTSIYRTESERDDHIFLIHIITIREKDAVCAQALVPFEISVPLDVYGLSAGTYQVMVYDVTAQFTFTQDNIIQGSADGG
jgi:inhibitor of cysteine peptidase